MLYQVPDQSDAVSPARAASLIEADPHDQREVLAARPARLDRSCAATRSSIPIDDAIFYVRPIYVEGSGNVAAPALELRRGHLRREGGARRRGVLDAVQHLLERHDADGRSARARRPTTATATPARPRPPRRRTPRRTRRRSRRPRTRPSRELLAQANQLFDEANQALANQDLATFDEKYKQAVALVAAGEPRWRRRPTTPTTAPSPTTRSEHAPRRGPNRAERPRPSPTPDPERPVIVGGPGIVTIWVVLIPGGVRPGSLPSG